jgi:hypothetical protein
MEDWTLLSEFALFDAIRNIYLRKTLFVVIQISDAEQQGGTLSDFATTSTV